MAILLASVYSQAPAKHAHKAKAHITLKKPVVHAKIAVPKVHAVKIGVKVAAGAKATVKAAPKAKLNLTGSCPAAKAFKTLEVLPKPIAYKTQKMCSGLKSGCCSEKSLNNFKSNWPKWVKSKSAFFWTLSKWPQALASILKHQNKSLKCRLPSLKIALPKVKLTLKHSKRILQSMNFTAPTIKINAKINPKFAANAKAGLKFAKNMGAGMMKTGAAMHKAALKVKANMHKAGLNLKAGAAMTKAAFKMNAGMMHKAALKVKAGMAGLHLKAGSASLKIKVRKAITKPSQFMSNTGCSMLFKAAWKSVMPFMRMRKAAAHLGLQCFKAVSKARSAAVCASCDNTQSAKFATGFNVSGSYFSEIPQACAPFLAWIGSAFKVYPVVYAYAVSTTHKAPISVTGAAVLAIGASWSASLGSCFTNSRRLQTLKHKVHAKPHAKVHAKVHAKPHAKIHVKVTHKKVAHSGAKFTIGRLGWSLMPGQKNLKNLDGSFNSYVTAAQSSDWTGKVTAACTQSPIMKKWVAKLILAETSDDVKFSKWFWSGAMQLNAAIGNGKQSRFMKFLGKKILGLKVVKHAKIHVKVHAKPHAKVHAKVHTKAHAKVHHKARRMQVVTPQMHVTPTGVDITAAKFHADVKQPSALNGDGQIHLSKSWMIATGLMMFVTVLLN